MINPQISKYITEERARGVSDEDIKKALLEKGWKEVDVENAFKAKVAMAHVGGLFNGRLDKQNFIKIVGVAILMQITLTLLFSGSVMSGMMGGGHGFLVGGPVTFLAYAILSLVVLVYEAGATVRRLHDIGQTGWWALGIFLVSSIPFLGTIIAFGALIYLAITPGDVATNMYGDVPNPNIPLMDALMGK